MAISVRQVPVWLAVFALCLPQVGMSADPVVHDVKLWKQGTLAGQVVDTEGRPIADSTVTLREGNEKTVETKTDAKGYFGFAGLSSGAYVVEAAGGSGVYRAWSESMAPPSAAAGVLIVAGDTTVRAQRHFGDGPIMDFISNNPVLTVVIVGAAIAIPIAFANDGGGPSSP